MGRNRVFSFMSQFSAGSRTPTPSSSPPNDSPKYSQHSRHRRSKTEPFPAHNFDLRRPTTPPAASDYGLPVTASPTNASPTESPGRKRSNSRPLSMVQTYNPPLMDVNADTPPELQPVFTLLNSHSNKLYQEGYFLKLDDQNTLGKPNPDRTWTECFAQLVGTVLSLWDAAELDAAGEDGEVLPKFINLTDASIKMIESLPTRSSDEQPLQNILSISTAGRNRYLLHFNSHHALVQWTAGIRLAIYEHSTLQEAYTGALIAGKAKSVGNINVIMERARVPIEQWVRVRFGAGVPWRRCWCVINPPDEKEFAKMQKEMKKRSPYDRSPVPTLKGDIRFYDARIDRKKQKKAQPIASITDAYSAYAIYPQAKALIDASTLLKIEGNVTIFSDPPSSSEGFVFIMPEVPPAVNGFEMLLRFLFPTWDTFGLYGRPGRLIASVLDARSLMFAMPKHKRYGYLDILDVTGLIVQDGSSNWNEREWRKQLKEETGKRMNANEEMPRNRNRSDSRQSNGSSAGGSGHNIVKGKVGFADEPVSTRSSRSFSLGGPPRTDSAPPDTQRQHVQNPMAGVQAHHVRNSSDPSLAGGAAPQRNDYGNHEAPYQSSPQRMPAPTNYNSQNDMARSDVPIHEFENMRMLGTPEPVSRPPAFNHGSQARPVSKVYHSPELRQANSRLSAGTLSQLATAGGMNGGAFMNRGREDGAMTGPSVHPHANSIGTSANDNRSREVLSTPGQEQSRGEYPAPLNVPRERSRSPMPPLEPPGSYGQNHNARPMTSEGRRPTYPPPGGFHDPRSRQSPGPDQRGGRPQPPAALMPGGQPPNARSRSANPPRQRPNHPPRQDSYNSQGGWRPNGPPEGFNPAHRKPPSDRSSTPDTHTSSVVTANEIIDHYARDPYAPSTERPPMERPRAGVLKTVGGAESPGPAKPDFNLPDVNFGPTYNYAATSPPRNRGPQGNPGHPNQGPRPNPQGQMSPGRRPVPARAGTADNMKRTMPWQPVGAAPGMGAPGVSPEEYVQQRAAAQPQYAHARTPSGNVLPGASEGATPGVKRRSSSEMLHKHGRSNSTDLLQRPSSQSGNSMLNWEGAGNASSHLTAREQEHMARVTGGPLVNVAGQGRGPSPGPGLVGAIDAREREKHQLRQGANSQAAHYGMNQRPNQGPPSMQYQQPQPQWAMGDRSMSPQPMYSPQPGEQRMQPPPPQGQYSYGSGPGRNYPPQYHGQAF